MPNNKVNLSDLKDLLARFFDKEYELTDDIVSLSAKCLFEGFNFQNQERYPEMQLALKYLRNVIQRNQFLDLESLVNYYKIKETKAEAIFEKLKDTDPEECMAISFRDACTMYMRNVPEDHKFKSGALYYIQNEECESSTIEVITYNASIEDEKRYMAQVQGNKLMRKSEECCLSTDRINELVSN